MTSSGRFAFTDISLRKLAISLVLILFHQTTKVLNVLLNSFCLIKSSVNYLWTREGIILGEGNP